jgi:hypothetical protein
MIAARGRIRQVEREYCGQDGGQKPYGQGGQLWNRSTIAIGDRAIYHHECSQELPRLTRGFLTRSRRALCAF